MINPHALVIDDNRNNGEVLAMLLKNSGVSHTMLLSPRNLGEILESLTQIDVVFLDLELPNYSGFDVLKALQDDPRLIQVPIVAYTVHTSEANEARAAGFHSFLGKPLNMQVFPDQLQRILSGERVWEY